MVCFGPGLKRRWGCGGAGRRGGKGGGGGSTGKGKEAASGGGAAKREEGPSRWKADLLWAQSEMAVGAQVNRSKARRERGRGGTGEGKEACGGGGAAEREEGQEHVEGRRRGEEIRRPFFAKAEG